MSRASALPLMVDFTDSQWSGASGQTTHSRTYGSLGVTLSSAAGALTFNAGGPGFETDGLALHGDGIGIADDEIGPLGESLDVAFSSAVTVLGYYLLDLFAGEGVDGIGELALVTLSGAGPDSMSFGLGTAEDDVGFFSRTGLAVEGITNLSFSTASFYGYADSYSDFALAGILVDVAPIRVPEPPVLGLFGFGLAVLMMALRKRRAAVCAG